MVAAGVLIFGPFTDSEDELEGWDAARYQQIAEAPGRPWVDHQVEYPPGSVVLIKTLAQNDVVDTQRLLIALSLAIDLGLAVALERLVRRDVGLAYLLLGLVMVPAGLMRFDLWAAALAALGVIGLARERTTLAAAGTAVGAAIKVFPGLLLPVAIAARRWKEAMAGAVASAVLGAGWLGYGGTEAIEQVLSLRGVTGWHVESAPGSFIALFTDEAPRFEADAWRIGTLNQSLVLGGRLLTVFAVVALGWAVWKGPPTLERLAAMMLGSTAALLVTAPLLSPQFVLWLTPTAAMLWVSDDRQPVWLTAATAILTGLIGFAGPENLGHPAAALGLLARDALLVALIFSCWRSCRAVDPLRADCSSPRPAGTQP